MNKPSFKQILKTDYLSLVLVIIAFVIWIVIGYIMFEEGEFNIDLIYIAIPITLLSLLLAMLRAKSIQSLFENAEIVEGVVTDIWKKKDRGRVTYRYIFDGREYETGHAIHLNDKTSKLDRGDKVTVCLNKEKPEKALIREIYF